MLETFEVPGAGRIELCAGDLTTMGSEEAVDLIVVSAFPDDYVPTPGSVVGALSRIGVSVGDLAADKLDDLRATSSCWLSRQIPDGRVTFGFGQILCYEPRTPVAAAETVGDVFRAIVPFVGGADGVSTVAMPILASGDMGRPLSEMLPAILEAASGWMAARLPLVRLRILVQPDRAGTAQKEWATWAAAGLTPQVDAALDADRPYDVFVSYAREDGADVADQVIKNLLSAKPTSKVFLGRNEIDVEASWQQAIHDCVNTCRKVVVLITPEFLQSKVCEEELNHARLRHRESEPHSLYPMYVRSADLKQRHDIRVLIGELRTKGPPAPESAKYSDCREANGEAIRRACQALADEL